MNTATDWKFGLVAAAIVVLAILCLRYFRHGDVAALSLVFGIGVSDVIAFGRLDHSWLAVGIDVAVQTAALLVGITAVTILFAAAAAVHLYHLRDADSSCTVEN